jgi:hypothetical protein
MHGLFNGVKMNDNVKENGGVNGPYDVNTIDVNCSVPTGESLAGTMFAVVAAIPSPWDMPR